MLCGEKNKKQKKKDKEQSGIGVKKIEICLDQHVLSRHSKILMLYFCFPRCQLNF